ncbi:hypothetical protein DFP92_1041 [Yoonia sediminilitoris]|uniref:Uncharacterized protein n=1 Tax=Yoonia sediminilitoris TaxID=1286148 RepID=A0A2T6KI24_9RHOB|nr:hypothetical protein C8N45_1041 [Yoonia sediminilitoris]RCW95992.1 hypothetical protein DFP92_1041 [Yoonia sediminilitoris]
MHLQDVLSFGLRSRFAALVLPFSFGFSNPFTLPLKHYFPLELRNAAKDIQHQATIRSAGIYSHIENAKGCALGLYGLKYV